MIKLGKNLIFFLIISNFVSYNYAYDVDQKFYFYLDTHYHFHFYEPDGGSYHKELTKLQSHMRKNKISKAFLISGSYDNWTERASRDQMVINAVRTSPKQFIGICGLDIMASHDDQGLYDCLKHDEMKGVKIHMSGVGCFSDENSKKDNIIAKLKKVRKLKPFIIIHLNDFPYEPLKCQSYFKEVQVFFQITRLFEDLNFIIAHSRGPKELAWIGEQYNLNPGWVKNIYTEVSTIEETPFLNNLIYAWRKFGINRVLFGTDNTNPFNSCEGLPKDIPCRIENSLYPIINNSSEITAYEKELIFIRNGQNFFQLISR